MAETPWVAATLPVNSGTESLYTLTATPAGEVGSNPFPPGTIETARVETTDNDVAALLLETGVVR